MLNPDADLDGDDFYERETVPDLDVRTITAPRRCWIVDAAGAVGRALSLAWRLAWGMP